MHQRAADASTQNLRRHAAAAAAADSGLQCCTMTSRSLDLITFYLVSGVETVAVAACAKRACSRATAERQMWLIEAAEMVQFERLR